MKKELLTKIVLLRMGNVPVDQTLSDTSVTNVPQVSLDFLIVNVSNKTDISWPKGREKLLFVLHFVVTPACRCKLVRGDFHLEF